METDDDESCMEGDEPVCEMDFAQEFSYILEADTEEKLYMAWIVFALDARDLPFEARMATARRYAAGGYAPCAFREDVAYAYTCVVPPLGAVEGVAMKLSGRAGAPALLLGYVVESTDGAQHPTRYLGVYDCRLGQRRLEVYMRRGDDLALAAACARAASWAAIEEAATRATRGLFYATVVVLSEHFESAVAVQERRPRRPQRLVSAMRLDAFEQLSAGEMPFAMELTMVRDTFKLANADRPCGRKKWESTVIGRDDGGPDWIHFELDARVGLLGVRLPGVVQMRKRAPAGDHHGPFRPEVTERRVTTGSAFDELGYARPPLPYRTRRFDGDLPRYDLPECVWPARRVALIQKALAKHAALIQYPMNVRDIRCEFVGDSGSDRQAKKARV